MALGFVRLRLTTLGPKAVLSAALLIAVNTALVVGAGYWSLTRDFDARAERDIDANLRTLSLAFGEPSLIQRSQFATASSSALKCRECRNSATTRS